MRRANDIEKRIVQALAILALVAGGLFAWALDIAFGQEMRAMRNEPCFSWLELRNTTKSGAVLWVDGEPSVILPPSGRVAVTISPGVHGLTFCDDYRYRDDINCLEVMVVTIEQCQTYKYTIFENRGKEARGGLGAS